MVLCVIHIEKCRKLGVSVLDSVMVRSRGVQVLCKDPRTLAAGGGVDMEIARQLGELARNETGLEQYAIAKFAEALEVQPSSQCVVPRNIVQMKCLTSHSCVALERDVPSLMDEKCSIARRV